MKLFTPLFILSCAALTVSTHASAQPNAFSPAPPAIKAKTDPIRIGLIFPLTGGSADIGNSAHVGAQVAVNEINAVGGYMGRNLELVVRDDAADPDTGFKHAEDLVLKEKVAATLGFCNSGVAMKALDVFQKNKHILIVTCATGTAITAKYPAKDSFIFRTSARDGQDGQNGDAQPNLRSGLMSGCREAWTCPTLTQGPADASANR